MWHQRTHLSQNPNLFQIAFMKHAGVCDGESLTGMYIRICLHGGGGELRKHLFMHGTG